MKRFVIYSFNQLRLECLTEFAYRHVYDNDCLINKNYVDVSSYEEILDDISERKLSNSLNIYSLVLTSINGCKLFLTDNPLKKANSLTYIILENYLQYINIEDMFLSSYMGEFNIERQTKLLNLSSFNKDKLSYFFVFSLNYNRIENKTNFKNLYNLNPIINKYYIDIEKEEDIKEYVCFIKDNSDYSDCILLKNDIIDLYIIDGNKKGSIEYGELYISLLNSI